MMNEKMNDYYWLHLTPLYWLIPLCYGLCTMFLPLSSPDYAQGGVFEFGSCESVLLLILTIITAIFYEKMIGKIAAWIWVGIWFALLSFIIYLDYQNDNSTMFSALADMILSYRIFVLLNFTVALLIPLFLICHQWILSYKGGKVVTILFVIFVWSCSLYTVGWMFFFQDKLILEKYREGQQLVSQIESYKEIHGCYPATLSGMNADEEWWSYELFENNTQYKIDNSFEAFFNRCHKMTRVYHLEGIEYDSATQKWTHYK